MKKGQVIIFPTDTVYGIGTKINDLIGLQKIYKIKKRNFSKPLVVLFSSLKQIEQIIDFNDNRIYKIANFFWPGPLTLVLKTKIDFQKKNQIKTLGVRIPKNPIALELLKKHGPLSVTSVNISGCKPLNDYNTICQKFGDKVDYIYKNQDFIFLSKKPSTVLNVVDNFKILRRGHIDQKMIDIVLKK